jgi:hypothetical protein
MQLLTNRNYFNGDNFICFYLQHIKVSFDNIFSIVGYRIRYFILFIALRSFMFRDMSRSVIFSFLQEIDSLQTFSLENLFLAAAAPYLDNQLIYRPNRLTLYIHVPGSVVVKALLY